MCKKRQSMIWSVILSLLLTVVFCGCGVQKDRKDSVLEDSQKQEHKEQMEKKSIEELVIFYEDCQNLLDNFQLAHPEIPFQAYSMSARDLGPEGLEGLIRAQGEPDLILCSGNESLKKLIDSGIVAAMDDLYGEDEAVNPQEYLPGTFEVGVVQDRLYALPVSVNMFYITMRESVWENSEFSALPEMYAISDVLTAMEVELDKEKEEGYQNFYKELARPLEFLVSSGIVTVEDGTVQMDAELFNRVMRVCCKQMMSENALAENGVVWLEYPAANPAAFGGMFLAECWGSKSNVQAAPQVGLVYSHSTNMEMYGESVRVVFRPMTNAGEYGVSVQTFGLIGANTMRRAEAYEALRLMMEMPMEKWEVPVRSMDGNPTFCPVKVENAKALLNCVDESEMVFVVEATDQAGSNGFSVDQVPISEELKTVFGAYIDQISYMYRMDPEVYSEEANDIMLMTMYQCIEDGVVPEDYTACYEQVFWVLEQNLKDEQ